MKPMKLVAFRFSEFELEQLDLLTETLRRREEREGHMYKARAINRTMVVKMAVATLLGQCRKADSEEQPVKAKKGRA